MTKKIYALPLISESKNVGVLVAKSTGEVISNKDKDYLEQLSKTNCDYNQPCKCIC